ncbi:MAG: insulinase family protein [Streptosporangiales bacterium]|nr:insulinase family protein [Streptosporangiales bacterium]
MITAAEQRPGTTVTLLPGTYGAGPVRRTVLPSGLRVVTEEMPTVRSVTLGIWVGVGSRDEDLTHAGSTHFLEHLLFKGTARRTAMQIAAEMDAVGGEMNAFTAKEYTCYYARVLDDDLPMAVDLMSDLVTSSLITPEDVESERDVILEEIAMTDDEPSDVVHDLFAEQVFGDAPLGRPILGTVESIKALRRDRIAEHYRERYLPQDLVIAAAGHLDHDVLVRLVERAFADGPAGSGRASGPRTGSDAPSDAGPGVRTVNRRTEQANLVLGGPGLARGDDRRFALGVLNAALGGGMSSRLFQEVREQRGLAYSVYSFASQYAGAGIFGVYAGCLPAKIGDVLEICHAELEAVVSGRGLTAEELERGKGQMRGGLVLGLEDTGSRMSRLGKSELVHPVLLSIDDILARIDAVTLDDVAEVAADVLRRPRSLAVIGPYDEPDFATYTAA